jgi:hypothetical protein
MISSLQYWQPRRNESDATASLRKYKHAGVRLTASPPTVQVLGRRWFARSHPAPNLIQDLISGSCSHLDSDLKLGAKWVGHYCRTALQPPTPHSGVAAAPNMLCHLMRPQTVDERKFLPPSCCGLRVNPPQPLKSTPPRCIPWLTSYHAATSTVHVVMCVSKGNNRNRAGRKSVHKHRTRHHLDRASAGQVHAGFRKKANQVS